MLTCGRRTTGSSGYVLSWLISVPQAGIRRAPMEHSRILPLSPLSQFDFIERDGLEAPPTGQNKDNVYQCKKHSSASTLHFLFHPLPPASLSFILFHFPRDPKTILMHYLFRFRMQPMLRLEETDHACADCS
jgi:hypothetical protein